MESNLLKEAIADAKAVRQTALANAKVALEEAFSERYQQMFAEKLREDAEQEEGHAPAPAAEEEGMKHSEEENVSEQEIDELIKELESEVGGEQPAAEPMGDGAPTGELPGAGAPPSPAPAAGGQQMVMCPVGQVATPEMPPAPAAGAMGAPAVPGVAVPPVGEPAPMGAPAMGAAPMGGEPTGAEPAPSAPPSDVPAAGAEEEDEDVNLDELLESLKEEVEGHAEEEEEEEEGKQLDEKLESSGIGGGKAGGSANKAPSAATHGSSHIESGGAPKDGYAKRTDAKVIAKEATVASRPNQAKHATKDNLSTPSMGGSTGSGAGQKETGYVNADNAKVTAKEATGASRPNQSKNATKDNLSTPGGALEENIALRKQLDEATETIKYVKGQLNEINLLNAKLLYTNKLFKEYNMNNEQKMRIVEMFDLSKNVREVKLTYANIAESLNFSGSDIKRKAKPSANVQSITEGLASQPVGTTKPSKSIISEGKASQMVTRFQKIAGIQPIKK